MMKYFMLFYHNHVNTFFLLNSNIFKEIQRKEKTVQTKLSTS